MRTDIRPSVPADAPAIIELLAAAGLKPNVEPDALRWKYWQDREDYSGTRSFVATRGEEILAHAAVVPGSYAEASRRISVLHVIDWAARPNEAGIGVSLMKYVGRLADALLAVGGSDQTLRILPHIGFRASGAAEGYVRVLHPLRFGGELGAARWKLPARLARRSLWRWSAPVLEPGGWSISRMDSAMTGLTDALPRGTLRMGAFERSPGLFRHMLHCPIVPMELYALIGRGNLRGYFLLAFAPGQARIADCWVATNDSAAWKALMQCAAWQASRRRGIAELIAWSSDVVMTQALVAAGFHRRNHQPIFVRTNDDDRILSGSIRVQMLDNDAAYFHHGFPEFWA